MEKFFGIIGNPPYQQESETDCTRTQPIYPEFMDEAYRVGERVELVTPARFLFNAGQTKKAWNQKMLADDHLKVVKYNEDPNFFPTVTIKGGVAVTYHDVTRKFDPVGTFIPHEAMRYIARKATPATPQESLASIMETSNKYNFETLYAEHPEWRRHVSDSGRHSQFKSNVLDVMPAFTSEPTEGDLKVWGTVDKRRGYKWIHRRYVQASHAPTDAYKVLVSGVNGDGSFGEALSSPMVEEPGVGFTQTFVSIGAFGTREEAENALKYVKTKFARAMLSVLKITHHNPPATWEMVPLQDFGSDSDIDWSKPVPLVDAQLYVKYGLTDEEVAFIEENVQEMM